MINKSDITICEPEPFLYFDNGQISVTDGSSVWLVIVTCEAMMATANPPVKSLQRLVQYAEFYRDLAADAIVRGEDIDGKVWVNETAVTSSKPKRLHSSARIRLPAAASPGSTHAQPGS